MRWTFSVVVASVALSSCGFRSDLHAPESLYVSKVLIADTDAIQVQGVTNIPIAVKIVNDGSAADPIDTEKIVFRVSNGTNALDTSHWTFTLLSPVPTHALPGQSTEVLYLADISGDSLYGEMGVTATMDGSHWSTAALVTVLRRATLRLDSSSVNQAACRPKTALPGAPRRDSTFQFVARNVGESPAVITGGSFAVKDTNGSGADQLFASTGFIAGSGTFPLTLAPDSTIPFDLTMQPLYQAPLGANELFLSAHGIDFTTGLPIAFDGSVAAPPLLVHHPVELELSSVTEALGILAPGSGPHALSSTFRNDGTVPMRVDTVVLDVRDGGDVDFNTDFPTTAVYSHQVDPSFTVVALPFMLPAGGTLRVDFDMTVVAVPASGSRVARIVVNGEDSGCGGTAVVDATSPFGYGTFSIP